MASPCQKGSRAARPGAASTITRSAPISLMRQVPRARAMMSPTRDSITISSSSSPTRRRPCRASPSGSTTEEHAAVGNGARRRYGQALRTGTREREQPRLAIPQDPRRELSHLARTVTPGKHVERSLEGAPAQIGVAGPTRRTQASQSSAGKAVRRHGHGGHGLLGQHVQRVAHEARALDGAGLHTLGHDGGIDDLHPGAREDDALGAAAHLVVRPSHALQPAGHRGRSGHLQHQIDGTHIDAQFQAGSATTQGSSPAFSSRSTCSRFSLETEPWWACAMTTAGSVTNAVVEPMSERKLAPVPPAWHRRPWARRAPHHRRKPSLPRCPRPPRSGHLGMGRVQTEALRVQLVQRGRQLLAQTARVHEDEWWIYGPAPRREWPPPI